MIRISVRSVNFVIGEGGGNAVDGCGRDRGVPSGVAYMGSLYDSQPSTSDVEVWDRHTGKYHGSGTQYYFEGIHRMLNRQFKSIYQF